jgi:CheY-like chemotaxis protein
MREAGGYARQAAPRRVATLVPNKRRRTSLAEFLLAAMFRTGHSWHPEQVPLRCLLVDDNDAFLRVASVLLEREGMTVAGVASNSAEALRQAQALRPDVILVDVGLGDESGFDLARRLTQNGNADGAAVIMVSARAESDYAELIAASPVAGFVAKSELSAAAIARLLGRSQ